MAGKPRTQRRAGPAQQGLRRAAIVDAAVALIEREGAGALTMRRLGAEVGVEAMSLYNHVAGRDELLVAIADRVLEPLGGIDLAGGWRDVCRRFADALRAIAVTHPATFRLVGLQPLDSTASLAAVERVLGRLVDAGFAPVDALAAYRAVASYARGYALAEVTGFTVDASQARARATLSALEPDAFPILAGRAHELAQLDADAAFEHGLCALLDGLPGPA